VTAAGFRQEVVEGITVQVGQPITVNVRLQPGVAAESITVTGESPLLRTEDSDQSSVVNRDLLDGLPLSGRRFLDLALLVPNATPDGDSGLVSFAGEPRWRRHRLCQCQRRQLFYRGRRQRHQQLLRQRPRGRESSLHRWRECHRGVPGGRDPVSCRLRRSRDRLCERGDALWQRYCPRRRVLLQPQFWNGANDAIDKENGFARPVDILQQFGGSLGGPIVSHRAWYFVDYEQQRRKDPITAINSGFTNLNQDLLDNFGIPDAPSFPRRIQLPITRSRFRAACYSRMRPTPFICKTWPTR